MESLTNQEEVELRSKIEALGLEVTKVPSTSTHNLDEVPTVPVLEIFMCSTLLTSLSSF